MKEKTTSKKRYIVQAIIWLILLIASLVALPNINKLVREKGQITLPASATSQVADTIQNHWGRHENNTRQVVVVFNNGDKPLTQDQKDNIDDTINSLNKQKKKYHIKSMTAPNDNEYTKAQLISKDKTTELLQLNVDKNITVTNTRKIITKGAKTPGVKTYVTGSDILNDDFINETQEGIKKTETITIVFIFIVLACIFRSPLTPIFSLLSVGISMLISLSLVMNLASRYNFPLSNFTQVFMVVVLFGIGTDYNILMFDQFKAELSKGLSPLQATRRSLKIAGRTILFSGSSVLIGFSTLGLAKFSIYRSAVGVAVAVAILLLALLTLNPFFMAMLGKRIFWPSKKFEGSSTNKMWHNISKTMVKMPFIGLLVTLLCALPFFFSKGNPLNYDTLVELNDSVPAKQGFKVVEKHFSKGTAEPTTLYIKTDHPLDNEKDLKEIDELAQQIKGIKGVKTVATVTQPGGSKLKPLYVKDQLKTVTNGTKDARKGLTQISGGLDEANNKLKDANISSGIAGAKKLYDGSQQLQSGANTLANGAATLDNGMLTYANGVYTLNNGMNQLASATSGLGSGVSALADGANALNNGLTTLNGKTGSLSTGVNALANGANALNNGLTTLNGKTGELGNGVNTLTSGGQKLANGSNQLARQLNDVKNSGQMSQLESSVSQLQGGANKIANGLTQMQKQLATQNLDTSQVAQLQNSLKQLNQALAQLSNSSTPDLSNVQKSAQALSDSSNKAKTDASNLQNSLNQLKQAASSTSGQNAGLSTQDMDAVVNAVNSKGKLSADQEAALRGALQQISGQISEKQKQAMSGLSDSINNATTSAQNLQNDMQSVSSNGDNLSGQLKQLQSLGNQLGQIKTLAQNQTKANDASLQALGKLNEAVNGLKQINNALGQQGLVDGSKKVADGLNELSSATGQMQQLVTKAADGATQINNGVNALNGGLNQLGSQVPALTGAVSRLANGSGQLAGGINSMQGQIPTLTGAISALANGSGRLAGGINSMQGQIPTMLGAISALSAGSNQLAANAPALESGASQVSSGAALLAQNQGVLTNGLGQMYNQISGLAGQMGTLENGLATASNGAKKINSGLGTANQYLTGLKNSAAADTYYVPKDVLESKEYQKAEDAYLSQNKHAVKFTIVLDENPSSLSAMKTVDNIHSLVNKSIKGTSLSNAEVALGGETSNMNDTKNIASKDFIRTAIIMLSGILLALMLITRSILQPFYILGTLLLTYIMSLDITHLISKAFLGQSMLTWNTPFFSFIMLIALGVDYSIFLMMKYQEYDGMLATPGSRIIKAATEIGAVVVSAALILSGTFAALMPSGVLTLIQVALVVIIGLTILVFAIPTIIPSLLSLTYPIKDKMDKPTKNK
ncbi:MAG TPA: MMPL family transporter [Candidatus Ligilactobacillus excrementigallinarum]|uniref:MMPL family transporter n=1 Tax=Candidatus Ligilactobacillus excrementigallinarum TaxID=2838641 RepID=A0A9D1UW77_9LACO|nr:MMPL family transporter [Candidatus Ligilactobacillus excrementigallinarum]